MNRNRTRLHRHLIHSLFLLALGTGPGLVQAESLAGRALAAADPQSLQLIEAARQGQSRAAQVLLDGADDVNQAEADGMTALHYAVMHDDIGLTQALLRAGADVHSRSRYEVTPIYLAALNGSAAMTRLLLEAGANPNDHYREGQTILMTAARTGNRDTVELLLSHGADIDAREDWHGQTALMWAAAQRHAELLPVLVAAGAEVDARSNIEEWERQITDEPRDKWLPPGGMTPLMFAAREGCSDCVAPLVELGADVNAATPDRLISPLLGALINGHYDVAMALMDAGADVNHHDETGRTPLYAAVHFNRMPESNRPSPYVFDNQHRAFDVIERLLSLGADPNAQLSKRAPYRLKLDRGTDMMLVGGTSPFILAAKSADLETMSLLLEHGADPQLSTDDGINALMTAANLGTRESDITGRYKSQDEIIAAIQLCLDQGLDINARSKAGQTAVYGAAMFGLTEVVRFLHSQGATLDYTDNNGLSPLDAAQGKAGGYGFVGLDGVFHEETVALIESLK